MLLLCAHVVELLGRIEAAAHGTTSHAHAHESGHGTGGVPSGSLHGIGSGVGHTASHHEGVLTIGGRVLHLVDFLHILFGEGDGVQGDLLDGDASGLHPLCPKGIVHGCPQLIDLTRQLTGAQLQLGQGAQGGLQRGDELGLQLGIDPVSAVLIFLIAADIGIEQQRIRDLVGVHAIAADLHGTAHPDPLVHHIEHDGTGGTELVVHDLLHVEVVHSLISGGIASEGEPLADRLEGLDDALAQAAGEDGRLGGAVILIFARLRTDLHDLTLIGDDHTLAHRHRDDGTIGDDIVLPLGIGSTTGDFLVAPTHQNITGKSITSEELLPLIRQDTAKGSHARFDQTHSKNFLSRFIHPPPRVGYTSGSLYTTRSKKAIPKRRPFAHQIKTARH